MKNSRKKRILILAQFLREGGRWIDDFCQRSDFEFKKAPNKDHATSWHLRGATTPIFEWIGHVTYVYKAMRWKADCIITCFPQLALIASALLLLSNNRTTQLIAWNFNLGSLPSGWKRKVARRILGRVDRFIVHSRGEITSYSRWLSSDESKFCFVPLQKGAVGLVAVSPISRPYIISMGSANRDYTTLVEAVIGTGIKTVIISKKSELDKIPEHSNIIKLSDLSFDECDSLLSGAELNVVPIASKETAAGQVTFVTSLRMGIPTIATRCVGTLDYIRDGETGLLVHPGDVGAMREAILFMYGNAAARLRMGLAGRRHADEHLSDEAAGRNLAKVVDELDIETRR